MQQYRHTLLSVVAVIILVGLIAFGRQQARVAKHKQDRWTVGLLRSIYIGLLEYEKDTGSLPYDERGWEYALYKARGYVPLTQFDSPLDRTTTARNDDATQRLVASDYVYLNSPEIRHIDPKATDTPLVWERDGLRKGKRLVCRLDGKVHMYQGESAANLSSSSKVIKPVLHDSDLAPF